MYNNSSDFEVIEKTAKKWIEYGGDSEGILYCWRNLYEKVKELENDR